jgi:hypothetical protein
VNQLKEEPDIYAENLAALPVFNLGYVGGETWGTTYSLVDQFKVENEDIDPQGIFS